MKLKLQPSVRRWIEKQVHSGRFDSPEQVIEAAIAALEQQDTWPEFSPGELDQLLIEGERSVERADALDGDVAYEQRRRRRAKARPRRSSKQSS